MGQEKVLKAIAISCLVLSLPLFFQSCGPSDGVFPDRGVPYTSLVVSYAESVKPYHQGDSKAYIAQYDDRFDTLELDLLAPAAKEIPSLNSKISGNEQFVILIVNAGINPGGFIQLNDRLLSLSEYGKSSIAYANGKTDALTVWTPQTLRIAKLFFQRNLAAQNAILATRPECVTSNHPGPRGEYRDGALVVQAVSKSKLIFDPLTLSASPSAKMFWEVSVFQNSHKNECY